MNLSALVAAAYVEVQRSTGRKPSLTSRINRWRGRPVEPDFAALATFAFAADRCIVDIGANRGETIAAARLFQPSIPIVAFEPNVVLHDILRVRNAGDPNLTVHACGLSDGDGWFDLHVPYYKGVPFDGLASFRREEAATFLNRDRLVGFDPRHQDVRSFRCEVKTLDSFGLAPAFVKIDVQGLEAAVIRGGIETIKKWRPIVLLENNDPKADAADLIALGYRPHAWRDGELIADSLGDLNTFYVARPAAVGQAR
jgi:FkbM family methyltransferase